jgi:hypothetical protein
MREKAEDEIIPDGIAKSVLQFMCRQSCCDMCSAQPVEYLFSKDKKNGLSEITIICKKCFEKQKGKFNKKKFKCYQIYS